MGSLGEGRAPVPAERVAPGTCCSHPLLPSQGLSHSPPGGAGALPCRECGHMVEEEGTGENTVITFQRNEVRAPLFPI